MTTTAEHRPHVEVVQHHTTSMTLVAEEFEVDVRVEAKELAADGVVTLELHEAGGQPLPRWTARGTRGPDPARRADPAVLAVR